MALPLIAALGTFLSGWFARFLGASVIRVLAIKVILGVLVMTILPTVLYNLLTGIVQEVFSIVSSHVSGSSFGPQVLEVSGLAGWFATQLHLAQGFSLIMSAAALRVTLSLIPFVGKI